MKYLWIVIVPLVVVLISCGKSQCRDNPKDPACNQNTYTSRTSPAPRQNPYNPSEYEYSNEYYDNSYSDPYASNEESTGYSSTYPQYMPPSPYSQPGYPTPYGGYGTPRPYPY